MQTCLRAIDQDNPVIVIIYGTVALELSRAMLMSAHVEHRCSAPFSQPPPLSYKQMSISLHTQQ